MRGSHEHRCSHATRQRSPGKYSVSLRIPPISVCFVLQTFSLERNLTLFDLSYVLAASQVEMNVPHKPGRQDESERIRKAGGWITEEK